MLTLLFTDIRNRTDEEFALKESKLHQMCQGLSFFLNVHGYQLQCIGYTGS